jgi:hypothetical protein
MALTVAASIDERDEECFSSAFLRMVGYRSLPTRLFQKFGSGVNSGSVDEKDEESFPPAFLRMVGYRSLSNVAWFSIDSKHRPLL